MIIEKIHMIKIWIMHFYERKEKYEYFNIQFIIKNRSFFDMSSVDTKLSLSNTVNNISIIPIIARLSIY